MDKLEIYLLYSKLKFGFENFSLGFIALPMVGKIRGVDSRSLLF